MRKRKILIAGASGLVGSAAVRLFAQRSDWEVTAVSRRLPVGIEGANLVSVDLLDPIQCRDVFGKMSEVTHLIYAALSEKPGLLEGWVDRDQMQKNLAMLQNLFEPLEAAAKNLEHVTFLQGTKAYGAHLGPIPIPAGNGRRAIATKISTFSRRTISARSKAGSNGIGRFYGPRSLWERRSAGT